LAAVVETCAERGLGERSLRDIAEAAGTSHRMLIHHFGSREGLMVAVVREVEARQAALAAGLGGGPAERLGEMWEHLSDPSLRTFERLFFECYARGANGEAPFDALLPEAVDSWLASEPADRVDPALTRLALAVVRGLLLDLVATGDTAATTTALRRFTALLDLGGISATRRSGRAPVAERPR
jgi:AcrR family transcriptional regulator